VPSAKRTSMQAAAVRATAAESTDHDILPNLAFYEDFPILKYRERNLSRSGMLPIESSQHEQ
jgi:hypothetical protein